jgi:hypothetical protein
MIALTLAAVFGALSLALTAAAPLLLIRRVAERAAWRALGLTPPPLHLSDAFALVAGAFVALMLARVMLMIGGV